MSNLTGKNHRFNIKDKKYAEEYARRGRFDKFAALSFPDADEEHFKTCLAFLYCGFAVSDVTAIKGA